jgi:lysyl-tRNA synthetase class 2
MFITHYPADLVPLARVSDADPRIAESYQLLVAGWEIVKGYSELVDPVQQRKAFEEQAKAKKGGDEEAMDINEEFLTAMEHGIPPVTGFGMGIERLVTLFTGQKNLRDVVLFPLMRPEGDVQKTQTSTPAVVTKSTKKSFLKRFFS